MTIQITTSFNSKLVRLKDLTDAQREHYEACFNSKLVRLKDFHPGLANGMH